MAYIPTIHTFEDDVNENRGFDEAPISGGVNSYNSSNSILVSEKKESSLTKKVLTFIAILFILASLAVVGYYFYTKWQATQEEARLNREAEARLNANTADPNIESDLSKIFPRLAPGISPYISNAVQKNNVVILTIKDADITSDSYTLLYAYILAHKRDLNSDLFFAFKIDELVNSLQMDNELDPNYTGQNQNTDFATDEDINNFSLNENSIQGDGADFDSFIAKPKPISQNDLSWESKTLRNQDFEAASAGVITLIYGYSGKKYAVFTTSLKDFFDATAGLQ